MTENEMYFHYSQYLVRKYGSKVYKLPINLPITCPNRIDGDGCSFCAQSGTGFESLSSLKTVTEQILTNMNYIGNKYNADKFIAYFQNYTNTFLPLEEFKCYINEACVIEKIVEIDISTRPDCIRKDYLEYLKTVQEKYNINITLELGLQTVNYHTLNYINRGHGIGEFISAVLLIKQYGFDICTHLILNLPKDNIEDTLENANFISSLPVDIVKLHSLYIPYKTLLCNEYENGTISVCTKEEYISRLVLFVEHLRPYIAVDRLFSRVPENEAVFSNWGCSWWKLKDDFIKLLVSKDSFQGKYYEELCSKALKKVGY